MNKCRNCAVAITGTDICSKGFLVESGGCVMFYQTLAGMAAHKAGVLPGVKVASPRPPQVPVR